MKTKLRQPITKSEIYKRFIEVLKAHMNEFQLASAIEQWELECEQMFPDKNWQDDEV